MLIRLNRHGLNRLLRRPQSPSEPEWAWFIERCGVKTGTDAKYFLHKRAHSICRRPAALIPSCLQANSGAAAEAFVAGALLVMSWACCSQAPPASTWNYCSFCFALELPPLLHPGPYRDENFELLPVQIISIPITAVKLSKQSEESIILLQISSQLLISVVISVVMIRTLTQDAVLQYAISFIREKYTKISLLGV